MHESVHTLSSSVSPAQVIEALQQQRSRHEVLCLLLEAEQSAHRHTHHLLAALGAELDQWDTDVRERTVSIEMLVIGVAEGCSLAAQIDVKSWREVTIACTELKVWGSASGWCVGVRGWCGGVGGWCVVVSLTGSSESPPGPFPSPKRQASGCCSYK